MAAVDAGVVDELNTEDVRIQLLVSGSMLFIVTHNIKTTVLLLHGLCRRFDGSIGVDIDLQRLDVVTRDGFNSLLSFREVTGAEENVVITCCCEFAYGVVTNALIGACYKGDECARGHVD